MAKLPAPAIVSGGPGANTLRTTGDFGRMAELADATALGAVGETHGGSNPLPPTSSMGRDPERGGWFDASLAYFTDALIGSGMKRSVDSAKSSSVMSLITRLTSHAWQDEDC